MFANGFVINSSSGFINTTGDITFQGNLNIRDMNTKTDPISGFHDTYLRIGVSDENVVYSNTGHNHDASGWSWPSSDSNVIGQIIYDGRYYYAMSDSQILRMDSTGTVDHWEMYRNLSVTLDSTDRIYMANSEPTIAATDKASFSHINDITLGATIGDNKIFLSDGRSFKLPTMILDQDEFYQIDGNVYFVQGSLNRIYISKFNGVTWNSYSTSVAGTFVNSCVSNHEIMIAHKINATKMGITRFNLVGLFRPLAAYNLYNTGLRVIIKDHDLVIYGKDLIDKSFYTVYVYNINDPTKYQKLLYNLPAGSINIYHNATYIFIQTNTLKSRININKSTNLPFDSIGGLLNLSGNINTTNNFLTKSLVMGLVADSIYRDDVPIYRNKFLLEPGRLDDSQFEYKGDFSDSYISRYAYNKDNIEAGTYNDMTCSVLYNNTYYFGHRGDISSFIKEGTNFKLSNPARLGDKIAVKFLPLEKQLYALIQDFKDAENDFVVGLPTSPKAGDTDHTDFIPYLPGPWSVPFTKLFYKDNVKNTWVEDRKFTEKFGRGIVDAISHDNNLYVFSYDKNNISGVMSYKFSPSDPSGIALSYSGQLNLFESLVGSNFKNTQLYNFVQESDGSYLRSSSGSLIDEYPTTINNNMNAFNEFYVYNHPFGPYIVRDQVEVLYDKISPSSIYPTTTTIVYGPTQNYVMTNIGQKYLYRTLDVSFLQQESPRPRAAYNSTDTKPQLPPLNVNSPSIKIPIIKDYPKPITTEMLNNKFIMKDISLETGCNRRNIHFITSVTHNKKIYLLVQIDRTLKIYCIRELGEYFMNVPFSNDPSVSGVTTVFGDGISYAGIRTNYNASQYDMTDAYRLPFYLDFIPCEITNTLVTELDIPSVIGFNPGSVYILGDGDDLVIQKSPSTDCHKFKRYSSHTTISVGSNIYLPITCRVNHPTGRLYTFILGFFDDGSVGLVDNSNAPIEIVNRPVGRTQCIYREGRWAISSLSMMDGEKEYINYRDIQSDSVWGKTILDVIPNSFAEIYNPNVKKKWIIGEYDVSINDNLNVRETL